MCSGAFCFHGSAAKRALKRATGEEQKPMLSAGFSPASTAVLDLGLLSGLEPRPRPEHPAPVRQLCAEPRLPEEDHAPDLVPG